ncbi:MAG: hypothetical protein HYX91_06545 [Chloroflexi bacterium]|nr:hypothetical protein [Chloroflexota bacterium]
MKKILVLAFASVAALTLSIPALAAPDASASQVAKCAVNMGGEHVAQCAQTMEQGVSSCAKAG